MIEGLQPAPQVFDVPRETGSFGPFATPERRRVFSPDDVVLFRLLCGVKQMAPAKMFRKLVRDAIRQEIGTVGTTPSAKAAAEKLFATLSAPSKERQPKERQP